MNADVHRGFKKWSQAPLYRSLTCNEYSFASYWQHSPWGCNTQDIPTCRTEKDYSQNDWQIQVAEPFKNHQKKEIHQQGRGEDHVRMGKFKINQKGEEEPDRAICPQGRRGGQVHSAQLYAAEREIYRVSKCCVVGQNFSSKSTGSGEVLYTQLAVYL